ncbi:hypothetical protein T01_5845 [Trichinella spiralis]|uniref:Uncharacterized protein n=1 Tax=Trichinella spiralis TaxID=6334 RepID=A0A0V1C0D0_TRISP|nr:hypothetical protein T01_5845 [Trichinella spiralis]
MESQLSGQKRGCSDQAKPHSPSDCATNPIP